MVNPPSGPQQLIGKFDIYGFTHQNVDIVPNAFYESPHIAPNTSKGHEFQLRYNTSSIANGRIVYIRNIPESELTSNQLTIWFPQKLSQGIYFVTVSYNGKTNTMRLLVE